MTGGRYGAKCHLCQHILHDDEAEVRWPVASDECQGCQFCQEDAFYGALIRACGGERIFDPEVRAALHAFRTRRSHPLLDQLTAECRAAAEGARLAAERGLAGEGGCRHRVGGPMCDCEPK